LIKEISETKTKEENYMLTELNTVERNMFKALKNCPLENVERRWKRGHGYYLVGKKRIDPMNGETKFSFETIHIPVPLGPPEPISEEKLDEHSITEEAKKLIKVKIVALEKRIEEEKRMKLALEFVLSEDFQKFIDFYPRNY